MILGAGGHSWPSLRTCIRPARNDLTTNNKSRPLTQRPSNDQTNSDEQTNSSHRSVMFVKMIEPAHPRQGSAGSNHNVNQEDNVMATPNPTTTPELCLADPCAARS